MLKEVATLLFSIFFQPSFPDEKFIPSLLYLFIKGLMYELNQNQ